MPADEADLKHRDPQYLQGGAPAVSRGFHGLFRKRRRKERISTEAPFNGAPVNNAPAAAFAGAFLGCLATLHLGAGGFVPCIASALATILLCGPVLLTRATNLFPGEFFAAIYGGSFAGMTPVLRLFDDAPGASAVPASALFVLLSIVSGLAFCVVAEIDTRSGRRLAGGFGGRSGAIATVASFLFVATAPLFGADDRLFRADRAEIFDVDPMSAALTCAACMIGMCATLLVLRRRSVESAEPADRISIAASVAFVGLIALHLNDPNDTRTLDAFYAGCFLGMSTPERMNGWIQSVLGAILLTAMLILVRTLLPDVGGGLGFAALVTVVVLVALSRVRAWLTNDKLTHRKSPENATQASGRLIPGVPVRSAIISARLENATPASASGRLIPGVPFRSAIISARLESATPASASRRLIPGVPVRGAIITASSLAGLLLIGWLALPNQVASEEPAQDTAAPERVAEQPAPLPPQLTLVQTKPATVDEAIPSGAASAYAVNANLKTVTRGSPELNVTAIQTAQGVVGAADGAAKPGRAGRAESAATATVQAVQRGTPIDEMTEFDEEIFREFMRWRAARSGGIAQAQPQPVKRSRNPALQTARLTPAGLRSNPRGPTRTSGIRTAPGQSLR